MRRLVLIALSVLAFGCTTIVQGESPAAGGSGVGGSPLAVAGRGGASVALGGSGGAAAGAGGVSVGGAPSAGSSGGTALAGAGGAVTLGGTGGSNAGTGGAAPTTWPCTVTDYRETASTESGHRIAVTFSTSVRLVSVDLSGIAPIYHVGWTVNGQPTETPGGQVWRFVKDYQPIGQVFTLAITPNDFKSVLPDGGIAFVCAGL